MSETQLKPRFHLVNGNEPTPISWWANLGDPVNNVRCVEITPELAEEWLTRNQDNRPLSPRVVEKYAAAMKRGEWQCNGETIVFSDDGVLLQGQHRLNAIAKSGITVRSYVVFDLPRSIFVTLDSGSSRKACDVLALSGFENTTGLAALIAMRHCYRYGGITGFHGAAYPSKEQSIAYAQSDPLLSEAVRILKCDRKTSSRGFYFAAWLLLQKDKPAALRFFHMLTTGADLGDVNNPIKRFRDYLMSRVVVHSFEAAVFDAAMTIKVWNAWRTGKQVRIFRLSENEQFPIPV